MLVQEEEMQRKIRIEDSSIKTDKAGNGSLFVDQRTEKSSQDFAPIDSNQLGVYFSPVDVVNEDIMYSIADFNFDDFIGDPRDENKFQYKDLRHLRKNTLNDTQIQITFLII